VQHFIRDISDVKGDDECVWNFPRKTYRFRLFIASLQTRLPKCFEKDRIRYWTNKACGVYHKSEYSIGVWYFKFRGHHIYGFPCETTAALVREYV